MASGMIATDFFTPNYASQTQLTNNSSYTVLEDGYIICRRIIPSQSGSILTINGGVCIAAGANSDFGGMVFPVKKGDTVVSSNNSSSSRIYFVPTRR